MRPIKLQSLEDQRLSIINVCLKQSHALWDSDSGALNIWRRQPLCYEGSWQAGLCLSGASLGEFIAKKMSLINQ